MSDSHIVVTDVSVGGKKTRTALYGSGSAEAHMPYVVPVGADGATIKVDGSDVTQPVSGSVTALQGAAGSEAWKAKSQLIDENGAAYGVKHINNKPRVSAMPYLYDVAEGNVEDHAAWAKIGFNGALVAATEADLWSATGTVNFPASAMQMEIISSNNVDDIGTSIKSGTATGGSATSLVDSSANFLAATAVAVGDAVLLLGSVMEYGFVTAVAGTALTIGGGFSRGGSAAAGVAYSVLDKSATLGAQAVAVEYLDGSWTTKWTLAIMNGTTEVATTATDIYRVQSFRVVVAGSNGKPTGNLTLRNLANTPVYSYITAGYTRARNCAYTVPAGKVLYVTEFTVAYGYSTNQTHYCRIYTRATQNNSFLTPGIFYPFTEVICANTSQLIRLDIPTKLIEKVDIKVSAIATYAGIASVALRGWLESA